MKKIGEFVLVEKEEMLLFISKTTLDSYRGKKPSLTVLRHAACMVLDKHGRVFKNKVNR